MYLFVDQKNVSEVVKLVSDGLADAGILNSDIVSANQDEFRDKYELRVVEHFDHKQNIELLVHDDIDNVGRERGIAKCKQIIKEHIEKIVISYRTDIKVS